MHQFQLPVISVTPHPQPSSLILPQISPFTPHVQVALLLSQTEPSTSKTKTLTRVHGLLFVLITLFFHTIIALPTTRWDCPFLEHHHLVNTCLKATINFSCSIEFIHTHRTDLLNEAISFSMHDISCSKITSCVFRSTNAILLLQCRFLRLKALSAKVF